MKFEYSRFCLLSLEIFLLSEFATKFTFVMDDLFSYFDEQDENDGILHGSASEWKSIFCAILSDPSECAELLNSRESNVNVISDKGWTPLHFASNNGVSDCVELLLGYGADINARDFSGWTPLHHAARYNHVECVKLLLENVADSEIRNNNSLLPIDMTTSQEVRDLFKRRDGRVTKSARRRK